MIYKIEVYVYSSQIIHILNVYIYDSHVSHSMNIYLALTVDLVLCQVLEKWGVCVCAYVHAHTCV